MCRRVGARTENSVAISFIVQTLYSQTSYSIRPIRPWAYYVYLFIAYNCLLYIIYIYNYNYISNIVKRFILCLC